jgi:hypothetical protein
MILPISLGTLFGLGVPDIVPLEAADAVAGPAGADGPPAELAAEPEDGISVVEIGPVVVFPVSDVWAAAGVLEPALLLFAADAAFVPPSQAVAKRTIETRIERYIFLNCC